MWIDLIYNIVEKAHCWRCGDEMVLHVKNIFSEHPRFYWSCKRCLIVKRARIE